MVPEYDVEHANTSTPMEHENEAIEGNVIEGNVLEGNIMEGNVMEGNVKEVSVDSSVLDCVATIMEQAKPRTKKRRRRVNEISGRQKALKRLRKDHEAGRDAEECDVIFGKKNWPPPFEDTVVMLRSSLMQFSKKSEGWTKEDLAELRVYYTRKWKVPSVRIQCFCTVVIVIFVIVTRLM